MLIVMETFSTDEYTKEEYDYAIFKMEAYEAGLIAQKMNMYKFIKDSDPDLRAMSFKAYDNDLECEFFSSEIWMRDKENIMSKEIEKGLDKDGWVTTERIDPDITPRYAQAPNGIYLVLEDDGFFWRAYPQNSLIQIETQSLPREVLSRVL